jgi:hypothetical protein
MNILIPQLTKVKLNGYSPIFTETVEFQIDNKLFIVLGGNGLGKTTILQSVIFGIAGPSDENIEPQYKERRWNRQYFKDRLDNPNAASIEVTFILGKNEVTLKRSVTFDKISEFVLNGETLTDDRQLTDEYFETFLQKDCGYNDIADFNFIIHRLCYLSEKRENLAWEMESQIRILMQILSDRSVESKFRGKRAIVKEMDSAIRHKTVEINSLDKRIQKNSEIEKPGEIMSGSQKTLDTAQENEPDVDKIRLDILQKNVIEVSNLTIVKQKEFNDLRYRHSTAVGEIENLRDQLSKFEHAFFFEQLNKFESSEAKLAIYKLIHYHLCPACGTKSDSLYEQASNFIRDNCCPLCGTSQVVEKDTLNPGLEAELSEKIHSKINLEKLIISGEKQLNKLNETLSELNLEINRHILNRKPSIIYIEKQEDNKIDESGSRHKLVNALEALMLERNELLVQFHKLQKELDDEYENFNTTNNERIERLFKFYEQYATEFLGIKCTLAPIDSKDRFLNLKLYVPFFNNKIRSNSDSCSEAQRFFLDIAFRMALIDLISSLGGHPGTFICETPENALDVTYIGNVSDMFQLFSWRRNNTLLLTSNIQIGGIAQNILSKIKTRKLRITSFLNLVEIGNLSEVQASEFGRNLLDQQIRQIIRGTV